MLGWLYERWHRSIHRLLSPWAENSTVRLLHLAESERDSLRRETEILQHQVNLLEQIHATNIKMLDAMAEVHGYRAGSR